MVDRQLQEGPLELVAIRKSGDCVDVHWGIDLEDKDLSRPSTLGAGVVLAGAQEEPMEPCIEALGFAQAGQIAPGADEGLLDDVFRGISIAEDASRDRVQAVVCGAGNSVEGPAIALLCAFDQVRHPAD